MQRRALVWIMFCEGVSCSVMLLYIILCAYKIINMGMAHAYNIICLYIIFLLRAIWRNCAANQILQTECLHATELLFITGFNIYVLLKFRLTLRLYALFVYINNAYNIMVVSS